VRRPGKPWKHPNQTREVDVESNGNQQDEGGTMKRKVATGVAVGLATTAAAGVAKKLMDNQEDETEQQDAKARGGRQPQSGRGRSRTSTSRRSGGATKRASSSGRRTTKSQTKRTTSSARSSGTRRTNRTKEQLYNQAKRLGIEGRSSMSKAQLERAIQRRK
jgi:hypothetical protein